MSDPLDPLRRALDAAKAIQADIDAMGMGKPAPEQPLPEVPEALRYILWRYSQDHSGEDHQERVRVATEWLGRIAELERREAWQPLADAWYGDNEHMLVISQDGASVQEWLHSDENDVSEISLPDAFRLCRRVAE